MAYVLTAEGQYEALGTYSEPGAIVSATLPELVIDWTDIFEEAK